MVDFAKLRALLAKADFLAAVPGLAKCVTVERDDLRELLAIAEAVERAPVVEIGDSDVEFWPILGGMNGQRVRLLAIGEDG